MACDGKSSLDHAPLEGFTDSQRDYLAGLLDQLDLAAVYRPPSSNGSGGGGDAALTVFGTAYEDLTTQEQLKIAEHPDEMWPKLRRHAAASQMPEGGDAFMFKHHGLFNVQPAQPGFMCRLRIPACKLRAHQLAGLADLAQRLGGGYAHVTTRGNLQIREVPPQHIIDLLEGLYDLGLTCKGSGADSVRNITANPTAGFDPKELLDLSPYAVRLHHHILNTPSLHGIPRKFNIAFDGGGIISAVADTNDIGFVAHRLTDDYLAAHPETYERLGLALPQGGQKPEAVVCRVLLGGITGHKDFAISSGFACSPAQTLDVAVAMLNVFIEHADRTNRKRARLKYLLDDWGHVRFTEEAEKRLDFPLLRLPDDATDPRGPIDRQGHIGVHPQLPPPGVAAVGGGGTSYLGVALSMGRMSVEQMQGLAEVARRFGRGDVRLTVWQNLLIPHVPNADVDAAVAAIRELGLDVDASSFAAGVVACTGRFACQYASAHTKEHGRAAVAHLEKTFALDRPINIHLTGCTNSCAQHYIGDIGLVGASTPDGREAYHVVIGGGSDHDQGIARSLTGPVAFDQINAFLEHLIRTYLDRREAEESFLEFTRRQDDAQLVEVFLTDAPLSNDQLQTVEASV